MPAVKKTTAFTLIEVLIAMVIMTIVAALLIGAFHTGMMGYKKVSSYEKIVSASESTVTYIKNDISRFVPVDGSQVSFSERKLSFYARSTTPSSHLELITYDAANNRLKRSVASYLGKSIDELPASKNSFTLLDEKMDIIFIFKPGSLPRGLDSKKQSGKKTNSGKTAVTDHKSSGKKWPEMVSVVGTVTMKERSREISYPVSFPIYSQLSPDSKSKPPKTGNTPVSQSGS